MKKHKKPRKIAKLGSADGAKLDISGYLWLDIWLDISGWIYLAGHFQRQIYLDGYIWLDISGRIPGRKYIRPGISSQIYAWYLIIWPDISSQIYIQLGISGCI